MTYLPTEEELKQELERERIIIERSLEENQHGAALAAPANLMQ
jgi:hypothetical protein